MTRNRIRIWALLGARAGDNNQVIALAEAIGLPFETKQLEYNGLRRLGPRLLGRSLISLTPASRKAILDENPPDLTISAGHRSVAVVQALRYRSNGHTRSIHVGFPRISPARFDLVIATPQYPIADHPKLLRVPYAFTRAITAAGKLSGDARLSDFPAPRRLLVVGGPTLFWRMDETRLFSSLAAMLNEGSGGGSVLVTTSPRTPAGLRGQIADVLSRADVPNLLAEPRKTPSYADLLAAADSIHVTADSVAMISDAVWTGKPVALIPVSKSALGVAVTAITDHLLPSRQLYPQDLRSFWRTLADIGVGRELATPRVSTEDEIRAVLNRVRPILEAVS